jgi:hypothetical protein
LIMKTRYFLSKTRHLISPAALHTIPAAFLLFLSCNKLQENPGSIITTGQFYKTSSDAVAAVNAIYNTLNSDPAADFPMYGRQLNLMTDNASDNQNFSPSNTNPDVRALSTVTYVSSNGRILKNWQQHYFGINRADIAIDEIPLIPASQFTTSGLQARLVNEAKFIRGLLYFNLVRLFGAVPLVLHNPPVSTSLPCRSHAPRRTASTLRSSLTSPMLPTSRPPTPVPTSAAPPAGPPVPCLQRSMSPARIGQTRRRNCNRY